MKNLSVALLLSISCILLSRTTYASGFEFVLSNSQTSVTCNRGDQNCKFESVVRIYNRTDRTLYDPIMWTDGLPRNTVRYMLNGAWVEGRNIVKESTAPNEETINTLVSIVAPNESGVGYGYLYIDGKACNQTNPPRDCTYYAGTGITISFNFIDPPTNTPTPTPTITRIAGCDACDFNGDRCFLDQFDTRPLSTCMFNASSPECNWRDPNNDGKLDAGDVSYCALRCTCALPSPSLTPTPTTEYTPTPTTTLTPTPRSNSNSSVNSNQSSSGSNSQSGGTPPKPCENKAPASAPEIVKITTGSNLATIYWTEAKDPVTYYLVAYGLAPNAFMYGNPNVGEKGTTSFTVDNLAGNTEYCFVVRAGNECMPGAFSNIKCVKITGYGLTSKSIATGFTKDVLSTSSGAKLKDKMTKNSISTTSKEKSTSKKNGMSFFFDKIYRALANLF